MKGIKSFICLLCVASMLSSYGIMVSAETTAGEPLSGATTSRAYFEQTISQYEQSEAEFRDPQAKITDEQFFGVYDASSETWTTQPLLNYEEYVALSDVEEAAKEGDYSKAKEGILNYYQQKFSTTTLGLSASTSKVDEYKAMLMLENIIATCTVADIIQLTDEFQTFDVDVTSLVSSAKSTSTKRQSFSLLSLKKDGSMGLFYSKESEQKPYIEATVNGRLRTYYPIADTYIEAGTKSTVVNGTSGIMAVEESYSSIGIATSSRTDTYTKRGVLLFEFSDINANDKVTGARLVLTGCKTISDNPRGPETLLSYKDIVVAGASDEQWDENSYCWDQATTGDFHSFNGEYAWEPGTSLALVDPLRIGIRVWKNTQEEAYAYNTLRIMTTAMAFHLQRGEGLGEQTTLALTSFLGDFPQIVADATRMPCITPEKFTLILKYMHEATETAVRQWTPNEEGGNFGMSSGGSILMSGLLYPEFRKATEPLSEKPMDEDAPGGRTGGWRAVGDFRVNYNANIELFSDGSCIEVAFGYVRYVLNLFIRVPNLCANMNIDMNEVVSPELMKTMEKFMIYLMNISTPSANGGSWGQGDEKGLNTSALTNFKSLIDAVDNPNLEWLYSGKTTGEAPDYLSVAYDVGRKAVLRSGWDPQALAAQINADGANETHGHSDDLSLNFYAYGRNLLIDPLCPDYDTVEDITAWFYTNRAHNTIEINDVKQKGKGRSGELTYTTPRGETETVYSKHGTETEAGDLHPEDRELNPMYNYFKAETYSYQQNKGLYDDYEVLREILFIEPEYMLVTDYINPMMDQRAVNNYKQHWHVPLNAGLTVDSETGIAKTNFEKGANVIVAQAMGGEIPLESKLASGWYNTKDQPADYIRYEKTAPGTVTFNTILYPVVPGGQAEVEAQKLPIALTEAQASAFSYTIEDKKAGSNKEAACYSLHDVTKKQEIIFGDYKTDGRLAFVQKQGTVYDKAILRDGTSLAIDNSDIVLLSSTENISDLGLDWNGNEIHLATSKTDETAENYVDLSKVKIYAPYAEKLYINDVETGFTRDGHYVIPVPGTSGDNNPDLPTDIPADPESTPQPPSHGDVTGGVTDTTVPQLPPIAIGNVPIGGATSGGGISSGGISGNVPQNPYAKELSGHWGKAEIEALIAMGIVNGSGDSLFLNNAVTRSEFAALLVRALKLEIVPYEGAFSDVSGTEWYADILQTAEKYKIIEGSDGKAMPNSVLTREQMAKMLVIALEKTKPEALIGTAPAFADEASISPWARDYVAKATACSLMNGVGDNCFLPGGTALREQAFVTVYRLLNK